MELLCGQVPVEELVPLLSDLFVAFASGTFSVVFGREEGPTIEVWMTSRFRFQNVIEKRFAIPTHLE
jgi:hypothetical protein